MSTIDHTRLSSLEASYRRAKARDDEKGCAALLRLIHAEKQAQEVPK